MTVSGISANDITSLTAPQSTTGGPNLDKNAFLQLLVSQMKNQDPLSPQDNTQFIAQLAQFSSLEQMQQLNDNVIGLAALQQSNALMSQLTQSSALLGKTVSYTDPTTQTAQSGTVDAIKVVNGGAMLEINGHDVPLSSVLTVTDPATGGTSSGDSSNGQ